jgi:hypothetical protein
MQSVPHDKQKHKFQSVLPFCMNLSRLESNEHKFRYRFTRFQIWFPPQKKTQITGYIFENIFYESNDTLQIFQVTPDSNK